MKTLALCSVLIPLFGGLLLAVMRPLSERAISFMSRSLLWMTLVNIFLLIAGYSAAHGPVELNLGTLYQTHGYSFPLIFAIDTPASVYLLLTSILATVTVKYSRYYLHREAGYRRYFALILLMVAGSNLLAMAGTLDLLFAGWELIGLSSFLLIGFYWRRQQPARNAFIVFTVYRVCDIGLLAGTMLTHVLWVDGDRFLKMGIDAMLSHAPSLHPGVLPAIAALVVFAALGKSAQFPFINWLPRALEGPTPSSAIFYGALSVHAGAFLLIRTEPIWSQFLGMKFLIAGVGIISAVLGTLIGRTLSNIKGQIAYAAIAQVGLIFVEIALGLKTVALVHLSLHAFLRAYQILISPSIVAHSLRIMGSAAPPALPMSHKLFQYSERAFKRFEPLIYRLTLSDFYLWPSRSAPLMHMPNLGSRQRTGLNKIIQAYVVLCVILAVSCLMLLKTGNLQEANHFLASVLGGAMIVLGLITQTTRQDAGAAWLKIGLCAVLGGLAVFTIAPHDTMSSAAPYFALIASAWCLGLIALRGRTQHSLSRYHGHTSSSPRAALTFLVSLIIMAGMPLSPAFVAEDLLLHMVFERSSLLMVILTAGFTLISIATARIFTRVYLGRPRV